MRTTTHFFYVYCIQTTDHTPRIVTHALVYTARTLVMCGSSGAYVRLRPA